MLVGAGDAKTVRLRNLPTQSNSCVTALDMDEGVAAASFRDWQSKLFD